MTSAQADRIIKQQVPVTVRSTFYGEVFTALFVERDRRTISSATGGKYDRADLVIVESHQNGKRR